MKIATDIVRKLQIFMTLSLLLLGASTINAEAAETWLWPVAGITSLSRGYSSGHGGIDITAANIWGHDIRASKSGTVTSSNSCPHINSGDNRCNCNGGMGNYVIIDHGDGTRTRYMHMVQGSAIANGSKVKRGDVIGKVGSSGDSSGAHCHFDMWVNGNRVNNNPDVISYDYTVVVNPHTSKPSNVKIELEKTTFFSTDHVTYYCYGTDVDYFIISIYDSNGKVLETPRINPGQYCVRYYQPGKYIVYCEGYNEKGNTFSNTINFTVKAPSKPTNVRLELEKTSFLTTDHVTYYCYGTDVNYFIISIYDSKGNVLETPRVNPSQYCTRYYKAGDYIVYCEGYNSVGNTFSNTIKFSVKEKSATTPTTSSRPTMPSAPTKKDQTITANSVIKTVGNGTFNLAASAPGKLTYKSSNTKVAIINGTGKVTIKGAGIATITINAAATSTYKAASKQVTITVRPKAVALKSLANSKKGKLVIKWKKGSGINGYRIQIAQNAEFKGAKSYTIKKVGTVSKTVSVKKGKTYWIRIQTFKGNVASGWSKVKKIKIKK